MDHQEFVCQLELSARAIEHKTAMQAAQGKYDPASIEFITRLHAELADRIRELASEARMTGATNFDQLADRRQVLSVAQIPVTPSLN